MASSGRQFHPLGVCHAGLVVRCNGVFVTGSIGHHSKNMEETGIYLLARAMQIKGRSYPELQSPNGKNRTKEVCIMLLKSARLVQKLMGAVLGGTGAAVLAGDVLLCIAILTFGAN